jgi:hypothetical protein
LGFYAQLDLLPAGLSPQGFCGQKGVSNTSRTSGNRNQMFPPRLIRNYCRCKCPEQKPGPSDSVGESAMHDAAFPGDRDFARMGNRTRCSSSESTLLNLYFQPADSSRRQESLAGELELRPSYRWTDVDLDLLHCWGGTHS